MSSELRGKAEQKAKNARAMHLPASCKFSSLEEVNRSLLATSFLHKLRLQRFLDHLQGSFSRRVTSDEARGMYEYTPWNAREVRECLIAYTAPRLR